MDLIDDGRVVESLENLQKPCPAVSFITHNSFAGLKLLCAFDMVVMQRDCSNVRRRIREFGSPTSY